VQSDIQLGRISLAHEWNGEGSRIPTVHHSRSDRRVFPFDVRAGRIRPPAHFPRSRNRKIGTTKKHGVDHPSFKLTGQHGPSRDGLCCVQAIQMSKIESSSIARHRPSMIDHEPVSLFEASPQLTRPLLAAPPLPFLFQRRVSNGAARLRQRRGIN